MDASQQKERLLARLQRIPPRVNGGSVQTVRAFRDWHKSVLKELQKKTLQDFRLVQLQTQIDEWYAEGSAS